MFPQCVLFSEKGPEQWCVFEVDAQDGKASRASNGFSRWVEFTTLVLIEKIHQTYVRCWVVR